MINKLLVLLLILLLAPLIGGLYGILHDQLTYTISPEYYTKFKFYQFGLLEQGVTVAPEEHRLMAAIVGFFATWWMGVPIGIILGIVCIVQHSSARQQFRVAMQSMGVVILVAFVTGLLGLAYGYLVDIGQNWCLPEGLIRRKDFIAVGSMHNFSYIGGAIGLIAAVVYSNNRKHALEASDKKAQITIVDE